MKEEDLWGDPESQGLEQRLANLEAQFGALNPRNLAGISDKELRAATRANIFGDGSDGDVILDGTTDFNDFSSRSSTTYTLTRDLFARNLTVNTGVTLKCGGYRIFVSKDLSDKGTIHANGNAGNAGNVGTDGGDNNANPGGTGGTGGAQAHGQGSLPAVLAGATGGTGGIGSSGTDNTAGSAGSNGSDSNKSIGAAGSGGGGGGRGGHESSSNTGGGAGGNGGNGGSKTGTAYNLPRSPQAAYNLMDTQPSITVTSTTISTSSGSPSRATSDIILFGYMGASGNTFFVDGTQVSATNANGGFCFPVPAGSTYYCGNSVAAIYAINTGTQFLRGSAGSGAGGGGGGATSGNSSVRGGGGGGGGGSGSPGGFVSIFAYRIINDGTISANGGAGGTGGNGGSQGGGGGGGGAGGAGGVVILVYGIKSGSGSVTANGGAGGAGGTAGGAAATTLAGVDGTTGTAGANGSVIEIVVG